MKSHALAKRLLPLIFFPYLKKIYGNGIIATVKNANKLVAHWSPSLWYICTPKSGNAAVGWSASAQEWRFDPSRVGLENCGLTAKAASSKTICSQRTGCIEGICVNEEGENTAKDKERSADSKQLAMSWHVVRRHVHQCDASCEFDRAIDIHGKLLSNFSSWVRLSNKRTTRYRTGAWKLSSECGRIPKQRPGSSVAWWSVIEAAFDAGTSRVWRHLEAWPYNIEFRCFKRSGRFGGWCRSEKQWLTPCKRYLNRW